MKKQRKPRVSLLHPKGVLSDSLNKLLSLDVSYTASTVMGAINKPDPRIYTDKSF